MSVEFPGKGKVAVLRTTPETVLDDYARLMELAGFREALPRDKETIIKINISWQTWYPACSTTPWQLEGVIRALQAAGYKNLIGAHNNTVVVDAYVGERNNKHKYVVEKYGVRNVHLYEPQYNWVRYEPKQPFLVLDKIYPEGVYIPELLIGRNIIQMPTVKCVHPDTEVTLADGRLMRIGDLVEGRLQEGAVPLFDYDGDMRFRAQEKMLSLGGDGAVVTQPTALFWRTPIRGRKLWRVETKTGRKVTVSATHPFLTPEGWRKARELRPGERIAIPRKVTVRGESQPLPRPDAASGLESANDVLMPKRTSPEFWRWMGYFIADGWIQPMRTTTRFWWSNDDRVLREDFISLTESLFGLEVTCRPDSPDCYVDSVGLRDLFEGLGLPVPPEAGNKRVPQLLHRCPDEEVAAFLSGYFGSDGSVDRGDGLHVMTKSERLAKDVQYLLSRLGVVAFVGEHWSRAADNDSPLQKYHQISVYGGELAALSRWVRLRGVHRVNEGEEERFGRAADRVAFLADGALAWDRVVSVEEIEPDVEYLYDFTMETAPNFIGNGILLHNTHVFTTITGALKNAFGGLLNTRRHWTHSVIHETLVDLLMIQQDIHPGLFAVMDGTFAGDGPGPRAMRWHEKDVILASADYVAIDAISAHLQGFDPLSLPFIRIAHEMGLGIGDPDRIEIVGEDRDWVMGQNWHFVQEDTFASRGQKLIYHGWLHPLEGLLLRSPLVPWSYFASNFYHNVYWYPFVGRKRVEAALQTKWGRLFTEYGAEAGLRGAVMPGMEPKTVATAAVGLGLLATAVGAGAWYLLRRGRSEE